jgi:dTDP-4-dehydrorhamnose reductase
MSGVIVLGHKSFIASHLSYEKVSDYLLPDRREMLHFLDRHQPDVIVNCAGYTGSPNIDACENHKQETSMANTVMPIMLAGVCAERGVRFIHIGSGCVFYGVDPRQERYSRDRDWLGERGWNETDSPNPQSFYSKTKAAADLVLSGMGNCTILRIRMPVSGTNSPRNLLSKITRYKQVVNVRNSVSFVYDIRMAVEWVIEKNLTGIYNCAHPKPFTHNEFLNEFKKYVPGHTWEDITPKQLEGIVATPRSNCIIDSSKLISTGFTFADPIKQMEDCVRGFAKARLCQV